MIAIIAKIRAGIALLIGSFALRCVAKPPSIVIAAHNPANAAILGYQKLITKPTTPINCTNPVTIRNHWGKLRCSNCSICCLLPEMDINPVIKKMRANKT